MKIDNNDNNEIIINDNRYANLNKNNGDMNSNLYILLAMFEIE